MKFPEKLRANLHPLYQSIYGDPYGCFVVPDQGDRLIVIASSGVETPPGLEPWEQVSVSVRNKKMAPVRRCPTWGQMCIVKQLFWSDEESVIQIHPPKTDYVNNHAFCLHLWRPIAEKIPMPPSIYVGIKGLTLPV